MEKAVFGGGCFWCTEAAFKLIPGVVRVMPGYAGGDTKDPTYEEVMTGETGHAEVVEVSFDPKVVTFRKLLDVFFTVHNPTTLNKQGNDIGTQYRSIILYANDKQKKEAEDFILKMEVQGSYPDPIVTEIKRLEKFYPAEEYHHDYFEKHPQRGYCQLVIAPKLEKLRSLGNKD